MGCCGKAPKGLRYSWPQVVLEFGKSQLEFARAGMPMVQSEEHERRLAVCKSCHEYQWNVCQVCKCLSYIKAKLATEHCPIGKW